MQYVLLPHELLLNNLKILTSRELLVYTAIRRYKNKDTNEAFPSLKTIMKHCDYSEPTIIKMIKNLESVGYLKVKRSRNRNTNNNNIYQIPDVPGHYERISLDFLDNSELTSDDKATILALQPYMLNKNTGERYLPVRLDMTQISKIMNCGISTVRRRFKSLEDKGCLFPVTTTDRADNGLLIKNYLFDMKINMLAVEIAKQGEMIVQNKERINKNTEDIEKLKKELKTLKQLIL